MIIEKDAVSKSFSNAAVTYDSWAEPQKKIAQRLVELLPAGQGYSNILDLGCGTGNVVEQLLLRNTTAEILGIDIAQGMVEHCMERWNYNENIKFIRDDVSNFMSKIKYDLIISSCVFQWIDDFYGVINNFISSFREGGCLAIAVPIEGSFFELQESYNSLFGRGMPGIKYRPKEYYTDIALNCGLDLRVAEVDNVCGCFDGVDVLKYFKKIGATFQYNRDYYSLNIREIHQLLKYYKKRYGLKNGLMPITHKVLYLVVGIE